MQDFGFLFQCAFQLAPATHLCLEVCMRERKRLVLLLLLRLPHRLRQASEMKAHQFGFAKLLRWAPTEVELSPPSSLCFFALLYVEKKSEHRQWVSKWGGERGAARSQKAVSSFIYCYPLWEQIERIGIRYVSGSEREEKGNEAGEERWRKCRLNVKAINSNWMREARKERSKGGEDSENLLGKNLLLFSRLFSPRSARQRHGGEERRKPPPTKLINYLFCVFFLLVGAPASACMEEISFIALFFASVSRRAESK